jgi:hypothetical protein
MPASGFRTGTHPKYEPFTSASPVLHAQLRMTSQAKLKCPYERFPMFQSSPAMGGSFSDDLLLGFAEVTGRKRS